MWIKKKHWINLETRLYDDSHREANQNIRIMNLERDVLELKAQVKKIKKAIKNGW